MNTKALVKISQPQPFEPFDPLEVALELYDWTEEDDLDAKIEDFLTTVREGQLSEEQLEALALAMVVADKRREPMSPTLAYLRKFPLFTPNQLLAWGFDRVIPAKGLFLRFREAIATQGLKP